ncbi:MAG: patatin-like phospholipase family protein, partial [Planctomycetota bacterium]
MTTSKRLQGRRLLPDKVRNAELEYLRRRREAAGLKESCEDIEGNLVGLCLSGGGIRSATFCLGVLQAMTSRGLLKFVDYVSTVSGGGYLGSCLSSLTTIRAPEQSDREERDEEREERIRRGNEYKLELHRDGDHLRAESQVHHLRTHGDFLVTRQGLIRREVLRAIGSTTLGVSCTLFMFLIVLHIVVGLLFGLGSWLGGEGIWSKVRAGDVGGLWVDLLPDPASGIWIGLAALVGA